LLFRHHQRQKPYWGTNVLLRPVASWQKGSIENLNKHVRKYIPKGTDISQYGNEYIQFVEHRLNQQIYEHTWLQHPNGVPIGTPHSTTRKRILLMRD
jgi:hypothetical protein